MASRTSRPVLRSLETIVAPDPRFGRVLVLRDTQGITDAHAAIPPPLVPIVARFTGEKTCEDIAKELAAEAGVDVPVQVVVRLAQELEDALFLDSAGYRRARQRIVGEFARADVRPASHAGGAYHADPAALMRYIDEQCLGIARAKKNGNGARNGHGKLLALVAPHIDPWRGAEGYGHAYAALARSIPESADTFVVFGTSHAPMKESFALCRKAFDTPLGAAHADTDAIDTIAKAASFDPYADQFNHKQEHSIEFQVVFLKHLLGDRDIRIIPILAGLGEHQVSGADPARDDRANRFLDAVRTVVEEKPGRVVVVAGADLAHVGPRFGDPAPYGEGERRALESADRTSLEHATNLDASAFWSDVARDVSTRRVCGLGPIYSLLRSLPTGAAGELLHYEQTIDKDGSIVSHAAVGFYQRRPAPEGTSPAKRRPSNRDVDRGRAEG
jgi:AmmeMemoRadiSam system protein B